MYNNMTKFNDKSVSILQRLKSRLEKFSNLPYAKQAIIIIGRAIQAISLIAHATSAKMIKDELQVLEVYKDLLLKMQKVQNTERLQAALNKNIKNTQLSIIKQIISSVLSAAIAFISEFIIKQQYKLKEVQNMHKDSELSILKSLKSRIEAFKNFPIAGKVCIIINRIISLAAAGFASVNAKDLYKTIVSLKQSIKDLEVLKKQAQDTSFVESYIKFEKSAVVAHLLFTVISGVISVAAHILNNNIYKLRYKTKRKDTAMYLKAINRRNDSHKLFRMMRRIDALTERLECAIHDYHMLRDAGVKGMKKGEHRMARDPEYVESLRGGGGGMRRGGGYKRSRSPKKNNGWSTGAKVAAGLGAGLAVLGGARGLKALRNRKALSTIGQKALSGATSGQRALPRARRLALR